jgi:hypothetical protein
MAHFRATIKGSRGLASRLGGKEGGIIARVDGWNCGVTIWAFHRDGKDVFEIVKTGGSNRQTTPVTIAEITEGE